MEQITKKYEIILKALESLKLSVDIYLEVLKNNEYSSFEPYKKILKNKENFEKSFRDSMIQRFEYSVDLLWKFFKTYLEEKEKKTLEFNTPRSIFREMCSSRLITEQESEALLDMVGNRNKTSHIYQEEIADFIAKLIPGYYELISSVINRLKV